jgi:hypothetical protein
MVEDMVTYGNGGRWLLGKDDRCFVLHHACASAIKAPVVLRFVLEAYDIAPDNFWLQPSSTSGKWHPADEFVEGGKALHTMRAIKLGAEMLHAFPSWAVVKRMDTYSNDIICTTDIFVAALAIHDICANGLPDSVYLKDGEVATDPNHPLLVRELLQSRGSEVMHCLLLTDWADDVLSIVESHSGIWSPEGFSPFVRHMDGGTSALEFMKPLAHWVDYVVSRNFVHIDVREGNNEN